MLMGKITEVSFETLKDAIGVENQLQADNYILEYFKRQPEIYSDNVTLVITRHGDGAFSIHENQLGTCIISIRKQGKKTYNVLPIGLARLICCEILETYNLEIDTACNDNIFYTLLENVSCDSGDALDIFLYYMGVIFIDAYQLDIKNSNAVVESRNYMLFDGQKNEFISIDSELEYFNVIYIAEFWHNKSKIKISKLYPESHPKNNTFFISVHELINNYLNG